MSDSWISWNPRIEDPSKPRPSSKTSSVSSWAGIEKVAEANVDDLDAFVLHRVEHVTGCRHCCLLRASAERRAKRR
jgi:hypothetical protein